MKKKIVILCLTAFVGMLSYDASMRWMSFGGSASADGALGIETAAAEPNVHCQQEETRVDEGYGVSAIELREICR